MKTITLFFSGFSYAIRLVIRKKLYTLFIPSILISLFFFLFFSGGKSLASLFSFMEDWRFFGWLFSSTKSVIGLISFTLFEFFILVLLSPINGLFAEKAREDLTGEELSFSFSAFLRSLKRMLVILMVGFFAQVMLLFVLWVFSFLFGDRFFEIASMLNVAFFVGFSFFDFGLELDEVSSSKSWKFARKNWMACILTGLVFNLGIYYPQKQGLVPLYLLAICTLPHLLTIGASYVYEHKKTAR